jgi:hypothetical protein
LYLCFIVFSCKTDPKAVKEQTFNQKEAMKTSIENTIESFIPADLSSINITKGDLNLDGLEDAILVMEEKKASEESDPQRVVYLLIGQNDGSFLLGANNSNVMLCKSCGGTKGDPFEGVTINKGYFSLEFSGGSRELWTRIITFKYNKEEKNWYIHKDNEVVTDTQNINDKPTLKHKTIQKILFQNYTTQ